jgi:hypothetical protein
MDGEAAPGPFADDLGIGRTPQASSGREQRDGFEEIRLAGAIVARKDDRARGQADRQGGIVAKIGQLQPADVHRRR